MIKRLINKWIGQIVEDTILRLINRSYTFNHVIENKIINLTDEQLFHRKKEILDDIESSLNVMYYRFENKKLIAVKEVMKLLLKRNGLEVAVLENKNGEMTPYIRRIKGRSTRELT